MNYIQHFFILCSGSNISVLKKTKTEWNKHAGIGGVILFTGIFASLSAGYALYTIFDSMYYAVGFGLLWGLMIFNLDRYIVSSMKKSGSFFQQFFMALPRIILAIFLGIVISKPLELKVFEKEINRQIIVIINRNKTILQDSVNVRFKSQTKPYNAERDSIYARINKLRADYNSAALELEKEVVGTGSETTTGKRGYGSNAKRKEEMKNMAKRELDEFTLQNKAKLDSLDQNISKINGGFQKELAEAKPVEDNYNGFAARMQALDELGKMSHIIALASLFIMCVFVILELSPVLVKLISPRGPYDDLMEKSDHGFKSYANEMMEKEEISSESRLRRFKEEVY